MSIFPINSKRRFNDQATARQQSRPRWWGIAGLIPGLVLLNLGARFAPEEVDLTNRRVHTLAPQTRALLEHLRQPIEVVLLVPREPKTASEREFAQSALMLRDLLERYRQVSPRITVREADPLTGADGRQLLQRYPDVSPPCALIRGTAPEAEGHEVLYARDLASIRVASVGGAPVVEFFGEQALTAALSRLTGGRKQMRVYVLTGHGELSLDDSDPRSRHGLGLLGGHLQELDIEVRPLDLRRAKRVPADADLVLLAGGDQSIAPEEEEALRRYWDHGGRGLVLCELTYDARDGSVVDTGVARLLAEYGVELGSDRVVQQGVTGKIEAIVHGVPPVDEHPLVRSLPPTPVQLFECRSVRELAGVSRTPLRSIPLLLSPASPESWADGDFAEGQTPAFGGPDDLAGPVPLAMAVERRQGSLHEPVLVVVGDAEFLDNQTLNGPSGRSGYGFVLACLSWLQGRAVLMADIAIWRNEGYHLQGTAAQQRGLVWKPTLIVSSLLMTAAVSVWLSRRNG